MICGIDEAGRGPLAGPVCAAAVILPDDFPVEYLNDSKKLNKNKRRIAEALIYESAGGAIYGIGWASHEEIDALNILKASLLAMKRAFEALPVEKRRLIDEVVVDGRHTPDIAGYGAASRGVPVRAQVKADGNIPQVMAASILAKEARDRVMEEYAKQYPQYGYERHKGYPTRLHCERILQYGPSPIQRETFRVPSSVSRFAHKIPKNR
ncbi:MAG: ribonuclease HII [Treponema sp.]|jgi:ribonuclease HII|nr:ribonuclease HII [Treponema sp.]